MIKFYLVLTWTIIVTVVLFLSFFGSDNNTINIIATIEIISILWLIVASGEIFKNKKTDKHGDTTYGKILRVIRNSVFINGLQQVRVVVMAYIPTKDKLEFFNEITLEPGNQKYDANQYVLLKYFKGDINVEEVVKQEEIPEKIIKKLNKEIDKNKNEAYTGVWEPSISDLGLKSMICERCGSNRFKKERTAIVCEYCNTPYIEKK